MQEITSRKNPQVQHLKKLGTDRAYREVSGEFLCDGLKLYEEAVSAGAAISLSATDRREVTDMLACPTILVPEDVLHSISPLKNPQTVLFACQMPDTTPIANPSRVLVLDGVQDPGNVGTLIRAASAFCVDQVILVGDCADPYNPKTVRAAMGATFRQSVCAMAVDELVQYAAQNNLTLLGAALAEDGRDIREPLPAAPLAVAIGSEGQGLSAELLVHCHGTVRIPMEAAAESLNAAVAGSILLWEMYRREV
ncbi:MAG: RNA methyltransferase [Oscillospiraceae bacterium]|nr:RNA methyltransferase [Oscillospiraceae bacterium]